MISNIEKNIINNIAQGDEKAFESLFKSYFPELCFYAVRFVEDMETAEEIVQDIFFNIWENKNKLLNIKTSVKSYLYTTVKNTCLNLIKHKKVENKYREYFSQQLQKDELDEANWMTNNELQTKILETVEKLPARRKQVFKMSRFEDLSYKEIASKLNISVKTVENQMGSALKFLRAELKNYLPVFLLLKYFV